jgi:hypothetical protein
MLKDAIIDESEKYRYVLERRWGTTSDNVINFVLLNPSTADASQDDPTVKACIQFAKNLGFNGLLITNLFAFRATDPIKMKSCKYPHGSKNDRYIEDAAKKSKMIIVAWGNHGTHCDRDKEVIKLLSPIKNLFCLGITASGNPKHPLYIKRTFKPILFNS